MNQSTPEPSVPKESAIVEVSPETDALVEQDMPGADDALKQETKDLVEAIKRRAQAEVQAAQNLTQETYLSALHRAKAAVEETRLIDAERIERSANLLLKEAEDNWQGMIDEMTRFGDRLAEAAQAAWDVLTRPKSDD